MCNYSLNSETETREEPAREGERLFLESVDDGKAFIAQSDPQLPVCVMPGTKLRLQMSYQMAKDLGVVINVATATFDIIPYHRDPNGIDALILWNGKKVALIDCDTGIVAEVISVPVLQQQEELAAV